MDAAEPAPAGGLPRRTFLAGSAVVGGTAAVYLGTARPSAAQVLFGLEAEDRGAGPTSTVTEKVYDAVCYPNCPGKCPLEAHVRDGKLVKTAPRRLPEPRYQRICLRGLSHAQWVYNPDRLKYPMKRVGKRGEGKWKRITWDEAIDEIAAKFTDIRDRYGSKAVAFAPLSGNSGAVNGSYAPGVFQNLFQATALSFGIDNATWLGMAQTGGFPPFSTGNEHLDMSNADLVILWGNNMSEADVQSWHFVADAKDRGAKLVVIDPHYSVSASKADVWIPLRPGSDPAFGLSMINVIISEKLYNKPFVLEHTTLPFLVRSDDGMFLRAPDGTTAMVWDPKRRAAVPLGQSADPALEGSFTVDGLAVKPAFQLLVERVADWTPQQAERYTEVPPEKTRWLARTYAATKKSFLVPGYGVDRWTNGDKAGRAIGTLAALTGNFGESGAALGNRGADVGILLAFSGAQLSSPEGTYATPLNGWMAYDAIETGKAKMLVPLDGKDPTKGLKPEPEDVDWPIRSIFFYQSNISNLQESNRFIRLLSDESKVEFVVVADSLPTDTVRYADIVLPVAHFFEQNDVVAGRVYLERQERAVEPAWESKSNFDMFKMLAAKFGWEKYYTGTDSDHIDPMISGIAAMMGVDPDPVLKEYHDEGLVRLTTPPYVGQTEFPLSTPTGRMEVYSERVLVNYPSRGWIPTSTGEDPLPSWEPPSEAWFENPLHKKYPLQYMNEHSRWRIHTSFWDQPWLRELDPEPYVEINPKDAEPRGITTGDYVEIFNDRGKTVARARVTGRMRPGTVNLPKGWQRHQTKDGSGFSDVTKNWFPRLTVNGSYFDTLVDVRKTTA